MTDDENRKDEPTGEKRSADKRRHPRVPTDKTVRARSNGREHKGRLKDISAGGAAINSDESLNADDPVDIEIEDMKELTAKVTRSLDDGYAVEFDLDDGDAEYLLDEMSAISRSVRDEEF